MKISEMVALLQEEQAKRGDVEVVLHGTYGATSDEFEVMSEEDEFEITSEDGEQAALHVWTGIHTG